LSLPVTRAASTYSWSSRHHLAAHQAEELDPAFEGQGQDQVGEAGPQKGHHADGKDQEGKASSRSAKRD
jgi:hypothetical protein